MTTAHKLKDARAFRDMTQQALSDVTEVSIRLIQKYESDVRIPKDENLGKLTNTLRISPKALSEASIETYEDVMFMLFELEEEYGKITIEPIAGKAAICIDNRALTDMLFSWKQSKEERAAEDLREWEMTYPKEERFIQNEGNSNALYLRLS